jgi:hypothetical protein
MSWTAPVYRTAYRKRYGSRCFLDPKRLKYPVCTRGKLECRALNAAQYYARLNRNRAVSRKIKQLRKKCF